MNVTGQVLGAAEVSKSLGTLTEGMVQRVRARVQSLGLEVLRKVASDFLSGRALKVRTGRLRRSVNESYTESGTAFVSTVGTNVSYGRFWELGFSGTEQVRAHVRKMSARGVVAQVRAHSRSVNQSPRPFLRPALEELRPRVVSELTAALAGGGDGV